MSKGLTKIKINSLGRAAIRKTRRMLQCSRLRCNCLDLDYAREKHYKEKALLLVPK